jgi:4-carboxymuconolactone decarboxylase
MARLPYIDPRTASPDVRDALEALPPLNIFAMLAHADSAFLPYLGLGGTILSQLQLDPKLRELAILLVAERTDAEYEWVQHLGIAQALGIPDEQIAAVKRGDIAAGCLAQDARAVLRLTEEVLQQPRPTDATFTELSRHLPPRQIVELLLVIGTYHMLARVMTTLDIELDPAIGYAIVHQARRDLPQLPSVAGLSPRSRI